MTRWLSFRSAVRSWLSPELSPRIFKWGAISRNCARNLPPKSEVTGFGPLYFESAFVEKIEMVIRKTYEGDVNLKGRTNSHPNILGGGNAFLRLPPTRFRRPWLTRGTYNNLPNQLLVLTAGATFRGCSPGQCLIGAVPRLLPSSFPKQVEVSELEKLLKGPPKSLHFPISLRI